jgi:hypothetical protein
MKGEDDYSEFTSDARRGRWGLDDGVVVLTVVWPLRQSEETRRLDSTTHERKLGPLLSVPTAHSTTRTSPRMKRQHTKYLVLSLIDVKFFYCKNTFTRNNPNLPISSICKPHRVASCLPLCTSNPPPVSIQFHNYPPSAPLLQHHRPISIPY